PDRGSRAEPAEQHHRTRAHEPVLMGYRARVRPARNLTRRQPGRSCGSDRGAVTAEFAVALPAVVLAFSAAVWGGGVATAGMRCVAAARGGARAAARGEPAAAVQALARAAAPRSAEIRLSRQGGLVTVQVRARVAAPAVLGRLAGLTVSGRAVAAAEDVV